MVNKSLTMIEKQIHNRIAKLGELDTFIVGSFVESKRKCGNKKCACANGGELHDAYILTKRENGKTKTIYIPVDMIDVVKKWTEEHKKLKAIIQEIDQLSEEFISATKARKKALAKSKRNGE